MTAVGFKDSQEAAFRRLVRSQIRSGPFTKSERDVMIAFVNHWFSHRTGSKPFVHPGRTKIAKKAGVSIKTVSRCFDLLRTYGVITAVGHLDGLFGNATEYTVSPAHLFALCALPKNAPRVNGGTNVPGRGRDKMSHRSCDVIRFPSQVGKTS